MFTGENKRSLPTVYFVPTSYTDHSMQQHQYPNQSQALNCLFQPSPYIPQYTACTRGQQVSGAPVLHSSDGEAAWNVGVAKRKTREQELLENSQISSIDFLQTQRANQVPIPQTDGAVSTGLRLSLEGDSVNPSSNDAMGKLKNFNEELNTELQKQEADFDQFLRAQGEQFIHALGEKAQQLQMNMLTSFEQGALKKLRDKDLEVENINRKNTELEEKMKQLSLEAHAWQYRAKYSESVINALKFNLQQAYAQNKETKEGCGDSEVDDAASCFNGDMGNLQALLSKENKDLKEQMACKVCRGNDISILLLPCRHLCLCKDCESWLDFCPICRTMKNASMQVFMS
eukprot:TRINITY_DN18992_c0_g1_i2.p1 TRINITY_DN18992_c0_g1~~TRINITY_DN18992_c0_g1_i2.p1  ORF type:complete len:344 (+),score=71.67 TRINITY_DN18992_c0_g1_i2:353-1384(+)